MEYLGVQLSEMRMQKAQKFSSFSISAMLFLLVPFIWSCGPSLPAKMSLPKLKITNVGARTVDSEASYVLVDDFIDARVGEAIAILDGKPIPHKEDIGPVVAEGVKQALELKGFRFSDTAPIVLSGEIRKWVANISSGFSGKVSAEGSLYVEILDPANKRIYAGVYNGFATVESPSIDKNDVREALRICVEEAIRQIAADAQLMRLLASF